MMMMMMMPTTISFGKPPGFNEYRCSFPGVKRPERDVDHSSPSSAEDKNEWSYTSTSPTCFHSVDKHFSFSYSFLTADYIDIN
jgi:hypothetical protein